MAICITAVANTPGIGPVIIMKHDGYNAHCSLWQTHEFFYGNSTARLSKSSLDQYLFSQFTLRLHTHCASLNELIILEADLKQRHIVGNNIALITTPNAINIDTARAGEHTHHDVQLIPWFEQLWVKFNLTKAFSLATAKEHWCQVGFFPFYLGRAISLGAAYRTSPRFVRINADSTIDYYAPGILVHGDLREKNRLTYDLYLQIVDNFADSLENNAAAVHAQWTRSPTGPFRGFGSIDFILAARVQWHPCSTPQTAGPLTIEPYVLFERAPEEGLEFPSDSFAHIGTTGLDTEWSTDGFKCGLEFACNFGSFTMKQWDRNYVTLAANTTNGTLTEQYTQVNLDSPSGSPAPFTGINQATVNASPREPYYNNRPIGNNLYNSCYRFERGFTKQLGGMMLASDLTYFICPERINIAFSGGWASGDDAMNRFLLDPCNITQTETFTGFVALEEIYNGGAVPSVFINGADVINRLTSNPALSFTQATNRFADILTGYTDILFIGAGATIKQSWGSKSIEWQPNVLLFWQDTPTMAFDPCTQKNLPYDASKFLGFEANFFATYHYDKHLSFYAIAGIFIPGQHYAQTKGSPIDSRDLAAINETLIPHDQLQCWPFIDDATAFIANGGIEYTF
ncbi:hypothetical protein M1466_01850 [Candidatus Dependentiae bacterium]|nr:hypothetical protein [Candidatus Dependentiae bacterium]